MRDRELRRRLLLLRPPDEIGAERRAWSVVRPAFEEREPASRQGPRVVRPLLGLAFALALVGAVVNPPVLNAIRDALGTDRHVTVYRHALFSLPAQGRLLANSPRGAWVVKPGGARRRLAGYRDASWSPHGLFLTALERHAVVALEPNGGVRWSLARTGRLAAPRWSPEIDGSTRIAYLRNKTLRVVAGDSTGDRLVSRDVASVVPAWKPTDRFVVGFVDSAGHVQVVDVDSKKTLWRSGALGEPLALAWSTDGTRLLALLPHSVGVFGHNGKRVGGVRLPGRGAALAFQPDTRRFAVLVRGEAAARGAIVTFDADRLQGSRRLLFAADGTFQDLAWSPDGRWVVTGWRSADAWLFVGPGGEQKIVSGIAGQLGSGTGTARAFPAVATSGWCCPASG